jgi:hypothetical protein
MTPITISRQTARRFILGKQGLWPGRRWKGKKGTAQAIRACEAVQLDPLNVAARSQDIVLHSRVLDYKPEYLYQVAYKDREFFDYGATAAGWRCIRCRTCHISACTWKDAVMTNASMDSCWRIRNCSSRCARSCGGAVRWGIGISRAITSAGIIAAVKTHPWRSS